MLQLLTLASTLRNLKSFIGTKQYLAALNLILDTLKNLGFTAEVAQVQALMTGISDESAREITVAAANMLATALQMYFGFAPLSIKAVGPDAKLHDDLEHLATSCEAVHTAEISVMKASTADSTNIKALDPATLNLIISGAFSLVSTLLTAWFNRGPVTPVVPK